MPFPPEIGDDAGPHSASMLTALVVGHRLWISALWKGERAKLLTLSKPAPVNPRRLEMSCGALFHSLPCDRGGRAAS